MWMEGGGGEGGERIWFRVEGRRSQTRSSSTGVHGLVGFFFISLLETGSLGVEVAFCADNKIMLFIIIIAKNSKFPVCKYMET